MQKENKSKESNIDLEAEQNIVDFKYFIGI